MNRQHALTITAATIFVSGITSAKADGVGFRGDGDGVYADATPVTEWSEEANIVWKAKMPSWSNSSPVPVGDKVFTCAEPFTLVCVDAASGAIMWQSTNDYAQILSVEQRAQLKKERAQARAAADLANKVRDTNRLQKSVGTANSTDDVAKLIEEMTTRLAELKGRWQPTPLERKYREPGKHGGTGYSTPTPVSDGKHVWAVFGNGIAACYTVDGKREWIRLIAKPTQGHGHSASPVLVGKTLVVAINAIYGLNAETGEQLWQAASRARWGTPVAAEIGDVDVVVTAEGQIINVADGQVAQSGMGGLSYSCPIVSEGMALFVDGKQARAFKLPEALGAEEKPVRAWTARMPDGRFFSSPVCHGGLVYGISDKSALVVLDAKSGEKVGEKNLGIRGACYTSLTVAGDYVIAGAENGEIAVVKAGKDCELVAKNKLDKLRSSVAAAGARLYVRGMGALYCIGAK